MVLGHSGDKITIGKDHRLLIRGYRCFRCGKLLEEGDKVIRSAADYYHENHFYSEPNKNGPLEWRAIQYNETEYVLARVPAYG